MIFRQIQVGSLRTNCYLLGDPESGVCCVADPGGEPEKVLAMVAETGLTPQYILLTHGHLDHTEGITGILTQYPDIPVYLHEKELGVVNAERYYHYSGAGNNQRTYGDGDTLPLGSLTIQVIHTPGHTLGSVVLLCEDTMISGDTLFAGSCGRCDLLGGNIEEMYDSLKRLSQLPKDYKVYPGHGFATTLETERRTNPYMELATKR